MKYRATSYLLVSPWSWNSNSLCEFHTFLALRHANICWNWKSEVIHHSTSSALLLLLLRGLREVSTLVLKQTPVLEKMRNVPASLPGTFHWAPQPPWWDRKEQLDLLFGHILVDLTQLRRISEIGLHPPDSEQPNPRAPAPKPIYFASPFAVAIQQPCKWQHTQVLYGKDKKRKSEGPPNGHFMCGLH